MKRLKFKKPFNGMDNALKLIPETYKVDGKEFEMTDGIETYRVKWESSLNEATVLMSSNKNLISEDMQKMKHLMGFKSEDTLGTLKGAARLDENKKFGDVWDKTKKLISESEETDVIEEDDVEALGKAMADSAKVQAAAKKINTRDEKIEASVSYVNQVVGDDEALRNKIARMLMKGDNAEDTEEVYQDTSMTNEMEIADDYSERESMAGEYQENPEGYINTINSLLNEYIRKKGIPSDLGFVPIKGVNEGDIASFTSSGLMIDVSINSGFGFDVYHTEHVEADVYDRPDGSGVGIPERMEMNAVAENVSFDQALMKVGELAGNDVSEEPQMDRLSEVLGELDKSNGFEEFNLGLTDSRGEFYVEFDYYQYDDNNNLTQDLGITIEGNLNNFDIDVQPYERPTLEYPGHPGGIEGVSWDGMTFEKMILHLENQENKVITGHEEIVATLQQINPNLLNKLEIEMEDYEVASLIDDLNRTLN